MNLVAIESHNTTKDYFNILNDPVHHIVEMWFPNLDEIFKEDKPPVHIARIIQDWFSEYEDQLSHLLWPPQLPDLNITQHLWSMCERNVRQCILLASSLSELSDILIDEWYKIPLQTVSNVQGLKTSCYSSHFLCTLVFLSSLDVKRRNLQKRWM